MLEELLIIVLLASLAIFFGIKEKMINDKNVASIPVRINVNGIRGKSTVTRLITGILQEAGYHTVGKTTGTDARMLYWFDSQEAPIKRRLEGPNIGEQRKVISKASDLKADALVSECMAVKPDYQIVFQEKILQANIGLIVNVLEDHMDVLGPTLKEVADSFSEAIPHNGDLIINNSPFVLHFKQMAKQRNTKVHVCDTSIISEDFLKRFEYMVFPENAALALAVADVLGIDHETAFKGMLKAWPDPGAMQIIPVGDMDDPSFLVNGFSANDPMSTINIWERVKQLSYPTDEPVVIMNTRSDRLNRTEQFIKQVLPNIQAETLVVMGDSTGPIVDEYKKGTFPVKNLLDLEKTSTDEIVRVLQPYLSGKTIYGIGNIHGGADELVNRLEQMKIVKESA
ncbi:poly-gamma-glutamate synthase PgsB [Oceanobacillus kimchii]|uniref:poly-gamma-glutamate synthase PgsB n=1 Tax=Oceanobacillus kimchii TaxID=746691 RepID=UPI0021A45F4F|nr:poly-gamma-glutamate synthase PgsB [Oceanobacillus kimchii]MCT1577899.1 poly-gamma-glutamate synthase PgsB [Oceanobacillus kimchii]MCT2136887.1 poly-gamma-glutamate synthase PgsB [Oceanobacillus kimchii]